MLELEPHLLHKDHILWDWNGTLINDLDICVQVTGEMMDRRWLRRLDREAHRKHFRIQVSEFYLSIGVDFSVHPYEELAHEFFTLYQERAKACDLYRGARELLARLSGHGKSQAILSAANETDLKGWCEHFGICHFFSHICGLKDRHAAGKIERGKELLRDWGVPAERVLLVGDMDHDAEVAKALGIDVLLLGDGHQSPERFEGLGCLVFPNCYIEE